MGHGNPDKASGAAKREARERLDFTKPIEFPTEGAEDESTVRLVTSFQQGDPEAFAVLYSRYFDRVYRYLRAALKDIHEAEDIAQQVFMRVFEKLPAYELRTEPFRHWLFAVARNHALTTLRKQERLEIEENDAIERRLDRMGADDADEVDEAAALLALDWISDGDLSIFVERLPLVQRQILTLRHKMGLSHKEIAEVLGRSATDVKSLHYRAVTFLRKRLNAVGRDASGNRKRIGATQVFRPAEVLRHRRFMLH